MTDEELVKRLRERGGRIPTEAADRIEALKDYIKELEEYKWMYEELQK